jgi:hypothetical protein
MIRISISHNLNKINIIVNYVLKYSYIIIIQQDAAVRCLFYFTAALLYMFRVLSTPIIRSTLTVSTASGTGHTVRYKSI